MERAIPGQASSPSPALLITGLPRCGSSWVGQVLGMSPGVRYRYESFNPDWVPALKNQFTHFKYLPPQRQPVDRVARLLTAGATGRQSLKQLCRAVYRGYWQASTRSQGQLLIKDPTACLLAGWLGKQASLKILVLVRHPCGFASSVARLGWEFSLQRLLQQKSLMSDHLMQHEKLMRECLDDPWQARGAFWAAVHTVLLNQSKQAVTDTPWVWASYETLCAEPAAEFERLANHCGLPATSQSSLISGSAHSEDPGSTRKVSQRMADVWKNRLSAGQIDSVMGIVQAFGLDNLATGAMPANINERL